MSPDPASPDSSRPRRRTEFVAAGLFALAAALAASAIAVFPALRREPGPPGSPAASDSEEAEPRSQGHGAARIVFTDVTREAGISFRHEAGARGKLYNPETFGSGCSWFDHDGDGRIDLLFVNSNLLEGEPDPSATSILYRNRGDVTFEETTDSAGLRKLKGKSLGIAVEDYDRDGYPDIFVANDSVPNFLLRNQRDGTFEDRGIPSGFATDADGAALAGMGSTPPGRWTADPSTPPSATSRASRPLCTCSKTWSTSSNGRSRREWAARAWIASRSDSSW